MIRGRWALAALIVPFGVVGAFTAISARRWYRRRMNEREKTDAVKPENTAITPNTGDYVYTGEGVAAVVHGPTRDAIRITDSRGWSAAADIADGAVEMASASGIKSEGEDLTLATAEILVRRLNTDAGTWGPPRRLDPNDPYDCEAVDTRGHRLRFPPLLVQVTRPTMPTGFWEGITKGSAVPPGPLHEAVEALWQAIVKKKPAKPETGVLAINAIRTPWFSLPAVVDDFRQQYGARVKGIGFREVWVVAWSEALTKRLHP